MNLGGDQAVDLVRGVLGELEQTDLTRVEVVICPPFTALQAVSGMLDGSTVGLGAQNMHWEESGAYTGEVSAGMLRDSGCRYVILGHSERRAYFTETDADVNRKIRVALASSLVPIVCVGETLDERQNNQTADVVAAQVRGCLMDIGDQLPRVVVAYEPVWAIGTGLTATPDQAQEVHQVIRQVMAKLSGTEVAEAVRIQYGGSMKPENAAELLRQPDIDGGLIGGASLAAESFAGIVKAAL